MPCAPEFSYLESASADAGSRRHSATSPARSPRLPHGTRGFLLPDWSHSCRSTAHRTTPQKNPQLREENADDRAGHRGPPSAAAGPFRRTVRRRPSSTSPARSPSSARSRRSAPTRYSAFPAVRSCRRTTRCWTPRGCATSWSATSRAPDTRPPATRRPPARSGSAWRPPAPGATNLVTPIADAHMDSVPIVAITGQVASKRDRHRRLPGGRHPRHHDAGHQAQLPGHRRRRHPAAIAEAFHIASTGRPGPVLVDIAKDALQAKTDFQLAAAAGPARLPPGDQAARQADPRGRQADHRRPSARCSTSAAASSRRRPPPSCGPRRADRRPRHHHPDGAAAPSPTATRSTWACRACTARSPRSPRCRRPT